MTKCIAMLGDSKTQSLCVRLSLLYPRLCKHFSESFLTKQSQNRVFYDFANKFGGFSEFCTNASLQVIVFVLTCVFIGWWRYVNLNTDY